MTTGPDQTNGSGEQEPVTVTDRRRIDPETGEVRDESAAGPGPAEAEPVADEKDKASADGTEQAESGEPDARIAELLADLQRDAPSSPTSAGARTRRSRDRSPTASRS